MRTRIAGSVLAVTLLAACGAESGGAGGDRPTIQLALPTSVTSFANADVVVAERQGFFADAGISVEWKNLKSGVSVVQGVVSGTMDIGAASSEPIVNAHAKSGDLVIVGSFADKLTVSMVTPKEIRGPADLRGRRLGIQEVGAFREVMTRMILQDAGLTRDDVEYLPTDAQSYVAALDQGRIQSAILQTEQAIAAQRQNPDLHTLVDLAKTKPDYFYGAFFVTKKWLADNRDTLKRFLTAVVRAHRFMYENKDTVIPVIAEATGFSEPVTATAYDRLLAEQASSRSTPAWTRNASGT